MLLDLLMLRDTMFCNFAESRIVIYPSHLSFISEIHKFAKFVHFYHV